MNKNYTPEQEKLEAEMFVEEISKRFSELPWGYFLIKAKKDIIMNTYMKYIHYDTLITKPTD